MNQKRIVLGQNEEEEFRISLAGAQEKIAFLRHEGKWCRPRGATPTTHIIKLPLGRVGAMQMDMQDSVENEWLCLQLFAAFGLPVPRCEIVQFGARRALAVERFDRAWQADNRWIARLPQEDFCQSLGLPGTAKYESDGGPGMKDIIRILDAGSRPEADKRAFVKAQILFWPPRGDGWTRQEFLPFPRTRRNAPADAFLRHSVGVADHGPRKETEGDQTAALGRRDEDGGFGEGRSLATRNLNGGE